MALNTRVPVQDLTIPDLVKLDSRSLNLDAFVEDEIIW